MTTTPPEKPANRPTPADKALAAEMFGLAVLIAFWAIVWPPGNLLVLTAVAWAYAYRQESDE